MDMKLIMKMFMGHSMATGSMVSIVTPQIFLKFSPFISVGFIAPKFLKIFL